jgi:hypothetical protein
MTREQIPLLIAKMEEKIKKGLILDENPIVHIPSTWSYDT